MDTHTLPLLALSLIEGIGPRRSHYLLEYFGTPQAVFEAPRHELQRLSWIPRAVLEPIKRRTTWLQAEAIIETAMSQGVNVVNILSSEYPRRLKEISDPPLILYSKGSHRLKEQKVIGIVGTRTPSQYGLSQVTQMITDLRVLEPVIVSGLAYGIDIHAHKLALKHSLRTEAVLGGGIDKIYPSVHSMWANKIQESEGCLWTEFPLGIKAEREHFPMRNRIIAGLCDLVLVIESGKKGGSMITAQLANAYNREVAAIPGRVNDEKSLGCHELIKSQQAHLVESAADVMALMQWSGDETVSPRTKPELTDHIQESIFDFLADGHIKDLDIVLSHLNISAGEWASASLELEMREVIKILPGNRVRLS